MTAITPAGSSGARQRQVQADASAIGASAPARADSNTHWATGSSDRGSRQAVSDVRREKSIFLPPEGRSRPCRRRPPRRYSAAAAPGRTIRLARKPPRQPVQRLPCAPLAPMASAAWLADSRGLGADDERDHQHPGERDEVFVMRDAKRQVWRDAEEIERGHAGEGEPPRRSATAATHCVATTTPADTSSRDS